MTDIIDPTGWTFTNNPHPNKYATIGDESDWRNWHEWDKDSHHTTKCHSCILRARHNNGNCIDGGEYFICLPKAVREGKQPYKPVKQTRQVKLI